MTIPTLMKHNYLILMAIALVMGIAFFSCKKHEQETLTPKITNDKVTTTATTATFTWTVDWPGKLISVVEVSENEDMSHSQIYGSETETDNHNFTVTVPDLKEATKYYYRYLVWNRYYVDNKFVMEVKSFTTKTDVPKVKTVEVTDVTRTTATVIGEVTDECGSEVTERGVCWSTSHNPTTSGSHLNSGTGTGSYSIAISNLEVGKTYYVRAYAKNSNGTAYGEELDFVTGDAVKPTVTTTEVTNIDWRTALGGGEVTDDGDATVTERGVCWSTSHNPEVSGSHANNGTGTGSYTVDMTGLTAGAIYYVRAYAKNIAGLSYGNEVSFEAKAPELPLVTTNSVTNISYTTATGGGNVTSDGGTEVTERGICWGTSHNPDLSNGFSHLAASSAGTGSFIVNMTGLTNGTTYFVRTYAKNNVGESYGNEVHFTIHTISVSANPTFGGTVTGGGVYNQGQSCTVHAAANNGYSFSNWTENGNVVSSNKDYSFTVNSNRTLVANFTQLTYTISVSTSPTSGGTVYVDNNLGTTQGTYTYGQSCTVHALVNDGYIFVNWAENGDVVFNDTSFTFNVTDNRTLVANFNGIYNGHDYVDLGLPSGTLWATCNVGANSPENYGNYYAWGEVTTKTTYNDCTYKYCYNCNSQQLTKYCNNPDYGYNGFTDDLTVLLPEDDAATINWGSGWCIPTEEQWKELKNNTTVTWTTQNGVKGQRFTGSNGNSLFLPAAGMRYENSLDYAGSEGRYWSNLVNINNSIYNYPYEAKYLEFKSGSCYVTFHYRSMGLSVRPVRSVK